MWAIYYTCSSERVVSIEIILYYSEHINISLGFSLQLVLLPELLLIIHFSAVLTGSKENDQVLLFVELPYSGKVSHSVVLSFLLFMSKKH